MTTAAWGRGAQASQVVWVSVALQVHIGEAYGDREFQYQFGFLARFKLRELWSHRVPIILSASGFIRNTAGVAPATIDTNLDTGAQYTTEENRSGLLVTKLNLPRGAAQRGEARRFRVLLLPVIITEKLLMTRERERERKKLPKFGRTPDW